MRPSDSFLVNIGTRAQQDDVWGEHQVHQSSILWQVSPSDQLRSSVGTGFKAPTLYQRYSAYGDESLQPEESIGRDFGWVRVWGNGFHTEVTVFKNRFHQLIEFDGALSRYQNVGSFESHGVESQISWQFTSVSQFLGSYTYTKAVDPATDQQTARRPTDKFHMSYDHKWQKARVRFDFVGKNRRRGGPFGENADGYQTLRVAMEYSIRENLRAWGRVENLLDESYEEVAGYGTPRRSFYLGLSMAEI